jgi:uncharacterized membrane protein YphA (DoxX/SURF4 family)
MWFLLRILIGGIFVFSGLGKLLSPYQNFLYVVQAYQLLPSSGEYWVAQIFPWIEFLVGTFLLLGLWIPWALRGALLLFGTFVVVVGQALLRGLPLENCGCFGELIHLKPQIVIVLDSAGLLLTAVLLRHLPKLKKFSLDAHFDKV